MSMPPMIGERPRLVMAMDQGELSTAALEAGVRLAALLGRDVVGVFVEDTALVEAAALPFTRMVPGRCAGEPAFDARTMQRALRIWAERARADLARLAEHWNVRWSFEVTRTGLSVAATRETDVLALAGTLEAVRRHAAEASSPCVSCPIVVLTPRIGGGDPVICLFEGAEESLFLAHALAMAMGVPMRVLAVSETEQAIAPLAAAAQGWMHAHGRIAVVQGVVASSAADLAQERARFRASALVVDRYHAARRGVAMEALISELLTAVLGPRPTPRRGIAPPPGP